MSYKIHLTQEELNELKSRMKKENRTKLYIRLLAIDLKNNGEKNKKISQILGVSTGTITNWFKLFLQGGFEGLCHLKYKPRLSSLEPFKNDVEAFLENQTISRIAYLQDYMKEKHGLCLSRWAYADFLRNRLNYSYKKRD